MNLEMIYLLFFISRLVLSYLASKGWRNRDMNQIHGFLIGLFGSPIVSYIACLALKDNKDKVRDEMLEEFHRNLNLINQRNNSRIYDYDDDEDEID